MWRIAAAAAMAKRIALSTRRSAAWAVSASFVTASGVKSVLRSLAGSAGNVRRALTIGSVLSFERRRDFDGGHAGGGGCLNADVGVFEDEAVPRIDAQSLCGGEKGIGRGLAARVVL